MGQGKLASGISPASGQQEVCPWRGEPCSWPQASYSARPKFRGGAWGLPLISTLQVRGSGLRGPESNPRSGWGPVGGTGGRWGGDLHHPKMDSAPQAVEQWGRCSLDVSPLRAGCVCQAGVAWAQSLDKGLQQRRLSPVGSWVARSRAVCPPPACPGPDTSRNQRQERRCLEAFLWCLSLPSRGCG